jgi:hypothetical protein
MNQHLSFVAPAEKATIGAKCHVRREASALPECTLFSASLDIPQTRLSGLKTAMCITDPWPPSFYDLSAGRDLLTLKGPASTGGKAIPRSWRSRGMLMGLTFSPDGRHLAATVTDFEGGVEGGSRVEARVDYLGCHNRGSTALASNEGRALGSRIQS